MGLNIHIMRFGFTSLDVDAYDTIKINFNDLEQHEVEPKIKDNYSILKNKSSYIIIQLYFIIFQREKNANHV